jgi:hypothetical protein
MTNMKGHANLVIVSKILLTLKFDLHLYSYYTHKMRTENRNVLIFKSSNYLD